ncbi:MAG: hypothetical protein OXN17_05140 [Candidatus Poribacteria bacterium]|nr:hypothetical protein [Candidatus Poribacteria bacterium]MDE0506791.1 hypothetical protein [Candidatus Poribacteria bacterium]
MSQVDNSNSANNAYNPVKGKLASMQECLTQLARVLPDSKQEYVTADRMTHSFVKSCFSMTLQRVIDINHVFIESRGEELPHNKFRSFFLIWQSGSIDDETLDFFKHALDCYKKLLDPYKDLSDSQFYEITRALLKHGRKYIDQMNEFFIGPSEVPSLSRT